MTDDEYSRYRGGDPGADPADEWDTRPETADEKRRREENVVGGMLDRWRDDIKAGGLRPAHNVIPINEAASAVDRHPAGQALLGIPETNAAEDCLAAIRTRLDDLAGQAEDYRVRTAVNGLRAILTDYGY
jgi:hypothetical protein